MTNNNTYDEVPYPPQVFKETQPDKLATIATVFGMQPPPVKQCRVLELGCASGYNLMAMAQAIPAGEFVGIDLSKQQIEVGHHCIEQLGLKNIKLQQQSVMELDREFGQFDYIIAHGLYSWVPKAVQQQILRVCHHHLVANGVAYISYNTYPGWHNQGMIREMMLYHTQQFTDTKQRIEQAKALLKFLVDATEKNDDFYSLSLRTRLDQIKKTDDAYLFHEYLEENNEPIFLHQFVEQAKQHDLQYLGDSNISRMLPNNFPPKVAQKLSLFTHQVQQEQYMDFLCNRAFRQSLLCHKEIQLDRVLKPERMSQFYVATSIQPASATPNLTENVVEAFNTNKGERLLSTSSSLVKSVLLCLHEVWPQSLFFDDLMTRALARLNMTSAKLAVETKEEIGGLLFQLYGKQQVELSVYPPPFTLTVSDRPQASPLSRLQAKLGHKITNLRCEPVALDSLAIYLLQHLEGHSDQSTLIEKVIQAVVEGKMTVTKTTEPGQVPNIDELRHELTVHLGSVLQNLANQCLLIA